MPERVAEYDGVAKAFHWIIALLIPVMLAVGWLMAPEHLLGSRIRPLAFDAHESFGIVILVLSVLRLGWRVTHRPPPFPSSMPRWQKITAVTVHDGLYALIIAMTLVGWAMISTLPENALFFGLFPIPNLPVLPDLPNKDALRASLLEVHEAIAWMIIAFAALHTAAALEHHFIERDDVLLRMSPRALWSPLRHMRGEAG